MCGEFVSRRCPLNDACFTIEQLNLVRGWEEPEVKTFSKLRCHGIRGICMIMGALVYVVQQGNGAVSYEEIVPREKFQKSSELRMGSKKTVSILPDPFSTKFKVSSMFIQLGKLRKYRS